MQTVLDVVDVRVGGVRSRPWSLLVTRVAAGLVSGVALIFGNAALAAAALIACLAPASALLNAAAAAGVATAALAFMETFGSARQPEPAVYMVLAAALLGVSWVRRREPVWGDRILFGVLAVVTAAAVASIAAGGLNPIRLHQAARSSPAPIALLAACAAACWTWRRRGALRYAAIGSAAVALIVFAVSTTAFLERTGRDPFLLPAPPFGTRIITSPPVAEFALAFEVDNLRVSPDGRLAAMTNADDDRPVRPNELFHVIRPEGELPAVEADDLVLLDGDRALTLFRSEGSSEIRDVALASSAIGWRQALPHLASESLMYDRGLRRWTVIGRTPDGRVARVTGALGGADTQQTFWTIPEIERGWVQGLASRGDTLVGVASQPEDGLIRRPVPWLPAALAGLRSHADVWSVSGGVRSDHGRTVLDTSCGNRTLEDGRLVCAAFDGTRTRVLTIDPDERSASALGTLDGEFTIEDVQPGGWLIGWAGREAAAVRLSTREAIRIAGDDSPYEFAGADATIVTATWTDGGARIRIYHLEK